MAEPLEMPMPVDPSWIDQLFVWVRDDNWPTVALLILVVVLGLLLYRSVRAKLEESDHCWDLYSQSQKEILDLSEMFAEAVTLARAPRRKEQQRQLESLEVRVKQFKDEKARKYAAEQEKRRDRRK